MHLALIEPGSYLPFERPVPFAGPEGRAERGVVNPQWAVRPISLEDFNRILELGMPDEEPLQPRADEGQSVVTVPDPSFAEDHAPFVFDAERERVAACTNRIVRDRVFRRIVLDAYDCRCAITGLKLMAAAPKFRRRTSSRSRQTAPTSSQTASPSPVPPTGCSTAA
jgi:putative restriction endonuclease